jgi:hypothetical protein
MCLLPSRGVWQIFSLDSRALKISVASALHLPGNTDKTSGFKTSGFSDVWFQNVMFTKRQVYKTSGIKTSGFKTSNIKTSIEIKASKRLVFKFDILIKQKSIGIAKFALVFKVKSGSILLLLLE